MSSMVAAMAAAAASSRLTPVTSRLLPVLAPVTLTDLLKSNDKTMWKLKLYKAPSDHFDHFSDFCDALGQNTTVTSVEVTWRFLRNLTNTHRISLMEAIGSLPHLEEIAMEVVGPTEVLTGALKRASKLKSLRIGKLRFSSNRDVEELAKALKGCVNLQQISLSSFQVMVQGNHIMDAEGMVWFLENQDPEGNRKVALDPLLDAMATLPALAHIRLQHYLNGSKVQAPSDSSLRSLCHSPRRSLIFNSCGLSDQQCMAIADELKSKNASSSLSILVVTRNDQITSLGWDAFVDMLAVNDTIVDFHHGEEGQRNAPSLEHRAKINYYSRLNQAGRGELLRGTMSERRKAWFDFLVRGRTDLDMIFFALLVDPSLYIV